ncbi:TetR family transcriptional regulator [Actinoplanes sp. NPDC020271]|uniref:TetR/AcrR family transcriptional regulator n=1 Tax=Actinoplanes sp. NPDC020271 TaxID=3363896 RepID=UPI0037A62FB9
MSPTRAEQRRQTESRILAEARLLFAEVGFDRTTIRAVAKAAGVDAGLVMHYFGSKDELFARAVERAAAEPVDGDVADTMLASLAKRLEAEPVASLALLRSMLTNADAADRYRTAGEAQFGQISAAIPAADAGLRASLLGAIVHGVLIERYLLRFGHLAEASPEQIIELLRPCFRALAAAPES